MVEETNNIEGLISKYLKGEATPDEAIKIENWRTAKPENEQLFKALEKTYALTHNTEVFNEDTLNKDWKAVESQLKGYSTRNPLWKKPIFYVTAASLILAFILLNNNWNKVSRSIEDESVLATVDSSRNNNEERIIEASSSIASFTLKDSSVVELTPGSKLILAEDFNTDSRHLELEGSGTFHVVHDEESPFVLKVSAVEIVDIGTIFRVENNGDTIKVIVDEGAVELRLNNKVLSMTEGDSAFYLVKQEVISRYKDPITREDVIFEFDGTSLTEVASILSEFYDRKIVVIDEAIKDCPLSVTFKNESLPTILDIVKELLDVKIVQNKEIIGIYGEGCN